MFADWDSVRAEAPRLERCGLEQLNDWQLLSHAIASRNLTRVGESQPGSDPTSLRRETCDCRCGGRQLQMAKLHDKLAAYLWRVQGIAALGIVSAHYARGSDACGFASGEANSSGAAYWLSLQRSAFKG